VRALWWLGLALSTQVCVLGYALSPTLFYDQLATLIREFVLLHEMPIHKPGRLLFCSARLVGELPLRSFALILGIHAEGGRGPRKESGDADGLAGVFTEAVGSRRDAP